MYVVTSSFALVFWSLLFRGPKNLDVFAEFSRNQRLIDLLPEVKPDHVQAQNSIIYLLTQVRSTSLLDCMAHF